MRMSREESAMLMAMIASARATCIRRKVGCVLVNSRGHILATGYNGTAAGTPHCTEENSCGGAGMKSGMGLEVCEAVHAEQNALLQCRDVYDIHTCFCTASPCPTCLKLLMNTGCSHICYLDPYPDQDGTARMAAKWIGSRVDRTMVKIMRTSMIELMRNELWA